MVSSIYTGRPQRYDTIDWQDDNEKDNLTIEEIDKTLEERENNEEQNETAIMMIVQVEIVVVVIIMIAMDKMIIPVVKAMTVVEITTRR